jgi:EAL domain-containing protein (putative c-di-GMP-specific phosphodiesterase class I)
LLTLEIHEASSLGQASKGADILTRLRLKSIKLALDDFGSEGTGLHGWYALPFGELKIDRALVADLGKVAGAATLVGGLIRIAHELDIVCCAVGVETADQLRMLDDAACDLAQGFYIGAPLAAAKLPQALADWTAEWRAEQVEEAAGT